jgi:DNA mismatch endonuclease (patch repair protein)
MALSRSEQMKRVRSSDTAPELLLRSALRRHHLLGYRISHRIGRIRPDVVFLGRRVAVFIDGCFWHGCPLHYCSPQSNKPFWARKLADNTDRDRRQTKELEALGWKVTRIFEHEVLEDVDFVVQRISAIMSGSLYDCGPDWRVVQVIPDEKDRNIEHRFLQDLRVSQNSKVVTGRRITAKARLQRPR